VKENYHLIKRIEKLVISLVLIIGVIFIAIIILKGINFFHKKSSLIRTRYINEQKILLKNEVDRIILRMNYMNNIVKREKIKPIIKNFLNFLKSYRFGKNKNNYIFILELLNINGGDKFAKMFFNPNRHDITGKYISDKFKDAKGKEFRKEFLKGLRKDGECFVEYWYKKIDNPKPSPKVSYFKLTDDKKYIVASGVYLDDVENKINLLQKKVKQDIINEIITVIIIVVFTVIMLIFIFSFFINNIKKTINIFMELFNDAIINNREIKQSSIKYLELINIIEDINVILQEKIIIENELKNKMQEITNINKKLENYSYTISHDLKEPIRSIRTFSEFILEDYEDSFDDEARDYFSRIIKASTKMALMIDDLLTLSRIGRINVEFSLNSISKIIENVKDTLSQKMKQTNTVLEFNNLPEIYCQKTWMYTVFLNLISNAIKYSDNENTVIEIFYDESPDFYEFSVKDNGKGIEKEQFDKIFGLFRKAHQDKNIEGSGAGLAIVSSVIEQHKGRIWVAWSEIGKGTIFKFTISKNLNSKENI